MKALIFILSTLFSFSSYGATYKFHAFSSAFVLGNQNFGFKETNILVVMDDDKMNVKFYADNDSDYDLIKLINTWSDNDENVHMKFKALNKDGEECLFEYIIYQKSSYHNATMIIYFSDRTFIYRLH